MNLRESPWWLSAPDRSLLDNSYTPDVWDGSYAAAVDAAMADLRYYNNTQWEYWAVHADPVPGHVVRLLFRLRNVRSAP